MRISLATKILLISGLGLICHNSISGTKTIDGGAGTNTLVITASGVNDLSYFPTINLTNSTLTLTDANGGAITASGIVDPDTQDNTGLTINSIDYIFVDPYSDCNCMGRSSMHDGSVGLTYGAAVDDTNKKVYLFQRGTSTHTTYHAARVGNNGAGSAGSYSSTAFTLFGSAQNDIVSGSTQADTISTYAGNDMVFAQNGADTIDLGTGNDVAFVNNADLSTDSSINGGDGLDTLNFGNVLNLSNARSPDNSVTINMGSLGNATNFENLVGTRSGDDTLTGDANANVLIGSGGTDTLNGGAGNDTLYGDWATDDTSGTAYGLRYYDVSNSSYWGDDILNGGDGDDILIGNGGDDTLDGGAGNDTLNGGGGIDTFVIRSGDGGAAITDADTLQDFTDGTDVIGMSGLNYSDLTIEQGSGSYSSHVVIKKLSSGEFLTIIQNISLSSVDDNDFSAI